MAVDIGPRIGIDGEAEFRKQINNITQQVKTFGTEMQALTSDFDANENSMESLAKKNDVLTRSIEAQQKKIELLQRGLTEASQKFGETDNNTLRWQQAVNRATTELNKMQAELKKNESAMSGLDNDTEDLADSLDDAGDSAVGFGDILSASLAADAIKGAISGIIDGLKSMTEDSREYRRIMGSLEVSSENAGYSAEETSKAYKTLYGVLGDNQTAATTTANLQALGLEQEQLNQVINASIGAWATYGDSIPIDGLAESINETIQAGQVTGTFADVLNWAGTSEDEFNTKLENCKDSTERTNLVLQELSRQGLMEAGEAWQANNQSLVDANQAAADYEARIGELGATVEPVFTAMQNALNSVLGIVLALLGAVNFEAIAAGINEISVFFTTLVDGVTSGSLSIGDAFLQIQAKMQEVLAAMLESITANLPQFLEAGLSMVTNIINGIIGTQPTLLSTAGEMITQMISTIISMLPQILETGAQLLANLIQGIAATLPDLIAEAISLVGEFVAAILSNLPQIIESGIKIIGAIISGLIQSIPDLIAAIPQIISAIWDTLTSVNWGEIGINILKGLANGILGAVGEVVDAAKQAAGRIANAFKDFFDINSPSGWAEDEIAGNIMKGFPPGFRKYGSAAVKAAKNAAGEIAGAFPENMEIPIHANGTVLAYDRMAAQMSGLQVVLNDGTLVGKLAPRLNNTLGGFAKKEGRFGT